MTTSVEHFVVTRFNVRSDPRGKAPSDDWLRGRFELFERYCLPSLEAQTETNFTWIIYFDLDTPAWASKRILEISAATTLDLQPKFIEGYFSGAVVAESISSSSALVLTTRVDNDDCVSNDFIEVVRAAAAEADAPTLINLTQGAQYADGAIYLRPYRYNPFISFQEENSGDLETVFARQHDKMHGFAKVKDVSTKSPMWVQIVHGANLANEVVGLRFRGKDIEKRFPLVVDTISRRDLLKARVSGSIRICLRLARKPQRTAQLARVIVNQMLHGGRTR